MCLELKLVLLIFLSSQCNSQILDNFETLPWFRGVLAGLPISSSDAEFFPDAKDLWNRPVVTIKDGSLRGFTLRTVDNQTVSAFQNIPYALPPEGPMRFRDPVKNLPWSGIRNARPRSPHCIQMDFPRAPLIIHGQEDCLYLNVYVPQRSTFQNSSLPVMVFLHGGAFIFGAGSSFGPRYLLDHDLILVTFNYRIGIFGFLSTGDDASPGNQALKDQVMALKWVQENIAAFGGDPNSISLVGQSAGAGSVNLHMISPLSRGLFHRGISQSGSSLCSWANIGKSAELAKRVGELKKCSTESTQEMIDCLRKVPARLLVTVSLEVTEWLIFPLLRFGPTVEHEHAGAFMTKPPERYYKDGEAANVPWIAGLTGNEFSLVVSIFMKFPPLMLEIERQWEREGWAVLNGVEKEEFPPEKLRKIWNFYMGNSSLTWETRSNFTDIASDRFMVQCTLEGMRYHSMYTKQNVYAYVLSYRGRYSTVQLAGVRPQDWGVSHNDDLMYLMNNPDWYPSLSEGDPEMEMSRLMTSIWSNFVVLGKPYFKWGNITLDVWQPIQQVTSIFSPIRFLDLNTHPQMMDDPYVKRYNFWMNEIYEKETF